jgi:small subunit ribosomal protein S5
LSKYYTPELLQSIKITESLVDAKEVLRLKSGGFRSKSKVAPVDEFGDYHQNDPKWDEPIIYPNQASNRAPFPNIPKTLSPDRTDLVLRFTPGSGDKKRMATSRDSAEPLAQLTGLDANYIKSLYTRPIILKRVSLQTAKGKIPNFFCLSIVGDKKGTIGLGIGKSRDGMRVAIRKSHWNAVKNLTAIPRYEERTILGDIEYKFHGVKLFMKQAPLGSGLRVHPKIFEMCEIAGIKDLSGKVYKSRNPLLVVQGFFEALTKQRSIGDLAAARGKKIVDLRKVYYSN